MFRFFRRFVEFEVKLGEIRVEVDALKDSLDESRAERDEFKQILFRKFGLIESENSPREFPAAISRRQPVHKLLHTLEQADKEKYWADKAKEADEKLKGDNLPLESEK